MKWIAAVLALLTFSTQADQCYDIDADQQAVLVAAYEKGADDDLGYTMMAIAWNESSAGKYRVNLETHDFGVMQNSLKTATARTNTKGYYNKMRLIEDLIKNDELSMSLALEELLYWRKQTGTWRNAVSAYNNGWRYSKGSVYLTKIIKHVKTFQRCLGGLVDKLEYLRRLDAFDPMPIGATKFFMRPDSAPEGDYIKGNKWRTEDSFYSASTDSWHRYSPYEGSMFIRDIPLEFIMDKFIAAESTPVGTATIRWDTVTVQGYHLAG